MIWATLSSQSWFCWLYRGSIFGCKEYNQCGFGIEHLVMSVCRVFSMLLEEGVCYDQCFPLAKLLAVSLLHFVLQGRICLLLQVFLDFLLLHPVPYNAKDIFFWVLVLKDLVGLHWTIQLKLVQHYWLGHRLGLLWYWMICLGNEQRSFCCFWDCIQVLQFGLFCWLWWLLYFF